MYVKKVKNYGGVIPINLRNEKHSQAIFSIEWKAEIVKYLLVCSLMVHGLTPTQTKELAYQFAVKNSVQAPEKWKEEKKAGREWFTAFLKRNSCLSIRSPEATSQGRSSGFNISL